MNNSWEVILEEDENGEIILPFPPELIERLDWCPGDNISFEVKDDYVILKNITAEIRKNTNIV